MRKLSYLLATLTMVLLVTGCGEDVIETKTCTLVQEGTMEQTFKLTATNDEINKVELTMVYDNAIFEVDTLSTLTDDQKEQVKTNMLTTLGLDSTSYEGLEIIIDIAHQMTVTLIADLEKADVEVLKKVGLDFTDTDMSLKRAISDMKNSGGTCN